MVNFLNKAKKLIKNTQEKVGGWRERVKVLKEKRDKKKEIKQKKEDRKIPERIKVDLSATSIAKATLVVIAVLLGFLFLFEIRDIIYIFLAALFLSAAFGPFVDKLEEYRLPRWLSIIFIYIITFTAVTVLIIAFIPILTEQVPRLISSILNWVRDNIGIETAAMQEYLDSIEDFIINLGKDIKKEDISAGLDALNNFGQNALTILSVVAGGVFTFVMLLVLTFFMVVEKDSIGDFFYSLLPSKYSSYASNKVKLVQGGIGDWLRGQILLSLVIGAMTYIGLMILGMPYAITLAILAGMTEFIPYLGPIIAAVPAVLIGANEPGYMWAYVIILYIVIQQVENNFAVPVIMEKSVGLSAIVVIFAMLVGEHFFGIPGIIIAVPVAAAVQLFVRDYTEMDK